MVIFIHKLSLHYRKNDKTKDQVLYYNKDQVLYYNMIMEFSFDKVADVLYIQIINGEVEESDEIAPGIIVDYSKTKQILGLEILNFKSRNYDLNHLITLNGDELIPAIVHCP